MAGSGVLRTKFVRRAVSRRLPGETRDLLAQGVVVCARPKYILTAQPFRGRLFVCLSGVDCG